MIHEEAYRENSRLRSAQANVRNYYMQFEETQTQDEIDSKIKEFEERSKGAFAAQVWTLAGTAELSYFEQ